MAGFGRFAKTTMSAILAVSVEAGAVVLGFARTADGQQQPQPQERQQPPQPQRQTQAQAVGYVATDALDVFDEPNAKAFSTLRLREGQRVALLGRPQGGWQAIAAPPGSFCWIDQEAIQDLGDGLAEVVVDRTAVRPGRSNAVMPGAVRSVLRRGEQVRLLKDHSPLKLPQRQGERVWKAIAPPLGDVRYVWAASLRVSSVSSALANRDRNDYSARVPQVSFRSPVGEPSAAPGPAPEAPKNDNENADPTYPDVPLRDLDTILRSILSRPIENWKFDEIRSRYAQKLARSRSTAEASAIRSQLDLIDRRAQLAQDFRKVQSVLNASRVRDREVERLQETELNPQDRPETSRSQFIAVGILNPSDKQYEGVKVYALYQHTGVQAYVKVPPGLHPDSLVGKRVGVDGTIRYSDALKAKVLVASDLIALD